MARWWLLAMLCTVPMVTLADGWIVDEWLHRSDSLRELGQDAASLDLLRTAQRHFAESGDPCSAALFADRQSRIHLDWKNPGHAESALREALNLAETCPDLQPSASGWRYALARTLLAQGRREDARQWLAHEVQFGLTDSASTGLSQTALEAMASLAHMSFEEGEFEASAEDHLQWAAGLLKAGERQQAVLALGWAHVCRALAKPETAEEAWLTYPEDVAWQELPLERRAKQGLEWGRILMAGKAWAAFDSVHDWPWAWAARDPHSALSPHLEVLWGLQMASRWRQRPTQALASSHHAELAARRMEPADVRDPMLVQALRLRAELLAETGALGPAYLALSEADSLSRSMLRAERARTGLFESEPWLAAIGDARTAMETERAEQWRMATMALLVAVLGSLVWALRLRRGGRRAHRRLRRLQQQWLPGKQQQIDALARSGSRMLDLAGGHALPAALKKEMAAFGRLAELCSSEMDHAPIELDRLCADVQESAMPGRVLDWSVEEEAPFRGDARQLRDFLHLLLEGVGEGGCRLVLRSGTDGLKVELDEFVDRSWWRQAMSLFTGDGKAGRWSLIRLRCDRMGGVLNLDCNAAGANRLRVSLPVYSA